MRERHNWAGKSHPSTCTCADCVARRNVPPQVRKKNKPKSQRGKPKIDPLNDALDLFKSFEDSARESEVQRERGRSPEAEK